jgi:hypothetical protein
MPNVEVVIKTITEGDDATRRSVGNLTELNSAISLVKQGLEIAQKVYDATAGATLEYANQVRQLSMVSGESAENTSRFIQVLDDYKIGADDALAATRQLTKNGLAPNIETLAKLSDEYLSLNSAEEKNAFVMKNLGRNGLQWVEVLNKGSTALRDQGDAIAAGLILSQKQLNAARANEIAMDNWNDSIMAAKIAIGNELIPALTGAVDELNNTGRAIEIMKEQGMSGLEIFDAMALSTVEYTNALQQANTETLTQRDAMLASAEATEQNAISQKDQEEAVRLVSQQNEQFLGVLGQVDTAMDAYREGLAEANAALDSGQISVREHKAQVAELAAQYEQARQQIVLSIVEMRLATDGWTNAEVDAYLKIGESLGAFTSDTANAARGALKEADKLVAGFDESTQQMEHVSGRATDAAGGLNTLKDSASSMSDTLRSEAIPALQELKSGANSLPPDGTSWTYYVNVISRGGFPKMPNHGESNLNAGVGYQSGQDVGPGNMGGGFSNYGTINIFANTPDEFLAMVGSEV